MSLRDRAIELANARKAIEETEEEKKQRKDANIKREGEIWTKTINKILHEFKIDFDIIQKPDDYYWKVYKKDTKFLLIEIILFHCEEIYDVGDKNILYNEWEIKIYKASYDKALTDSRELGHTSKLKEFGEIFIKVISNYY